jgi:hypothetical protein
MKKKILQILLILIVVVLIGCIQNNKESYPNIEGNWILKHYNNEGNLTKTEHVRILVNKDNITIFKGDEILCIGIIINNSLPSPQNITKYIITDCDFRGLGINTIYIYNNSFLKTEIPQCESCNPSIFTRE